MPDDRECAIPGESQTRRSRGSTYVVAFLAGITLFSVVLLMLRARQDVRPVKIVQFTSLPGFETRPSFSPDGTQIDFAATGESEGVDIYVKAIGDEKVLRLTEEPISRRPQWSPDGRTIAYDHWNKVGHAIFLMTPLGGAKHKIRELAEGSDGFTSWSPDSKLLAYDDKPAGESSGFFLMPTAGLPARRLTLAPAGTFDSAPAFSPDGKQIAFVRSSDEGGAAELRVVSLNNLDESRLATLDRMAGPVAWTPDSKRIIFCASGFFAGESDLFAVPASGGKPERLQIISSDAGWPAISPRGDKLAYTTAFFDTNIWKLSLRDSSPPTKLIASTRMEMQPTYSPDGRRVAYVSNRDGTLAIWVCNDDGTDQTRLVSVASGGGTPVWSPDGKQIAFDSNEGGRWNILLMDADGSNQVRGRQMESGSTSRAIEAALGRYGRFRFAPDGPSR